jgi:hypothetical protein
LQIRNHDQTANSGSLLQKAIYSPLAAFVLGQQWQQWLAVHASSAGKERKDKCSTGRRECGMPKIHKHHKHKKHHKDLPQTTLKMLFKYNLVRLGRGMIQ